MPVSEHGLLTTSEGIHIPYQWSYADAAARTGASGFVAAQVGKLARQLDDDSLWMLTATTPTWVQVGGGSGDGAFLRADGSVAGATGAAQDFGANGITADTIAESTAAAGVTVDGVLAKDGDVYPPGVGQGMAEKLISGGISPDTHFADDPNISGHSWLSDGTFTTPANHSQAGGCFFSASHTSAIRAFYAKSGTPTGDWHYMYTRISVGRNIAGGLRFDDGTDTNYIEFLADGTANDGTYTLKMIGSASGTVTSNIVMPSNYQIVIGLRYRLSSTSLCYLIDPIGTAMSFGALAENLAGWSSFRWGPVFRTTGNANSMYLDWYKVANL